METKVLARAAVTRRGVLLGLPVLILAASLLPGCTGVTATQNGGASGLTATPSSVSFGSVNTGSTGTRSVTVTNTGASDVSVASVSISGAGFNVSGVPAGLILAAGKTADLVVTFAPASAGDVTGKITVAGNSLANPVAITLSGTGVTPGLHSVTLTWNASTSSVAGYRTYRATVPGGPYTSLNSAPNPQLRWTDSSVQSGATYYYVITSVAADTTESAYSNQASAAVPTP